MRHFDLNAWRNMAALDHDLSLQAKVHIMQLAALDVAHDLGLWWIAKDTMYDKLGTNKTSLYRRDKAVIDAGYMVMVDRWYGNGEKLRVAKTPDEDALDVLAELCALIPALAEQSCTWHTFKPRNDDLAMMVKKNRQLHDARSTSVTPGYNSVTPRYESETPGYKSETDDSTSVTQGCTSETGQLQKWNFPYIDKTKNISIEDRLEPGQAKPTHQRLTSFVLGETPAAWMARQIERQGFTYSIERAEYVWQLALSQFGEQRALQYIHHKLRYWFGDGPPTYDEVDVYHTWLVKDVDGFDFSKAAPLPRFLFGKPKQAPVPEAKPQPETPGQAVAALHDSLDFYRDILGESCLLDAINNNVDDFSDNKRRLAGELHTLLAGYNWTVEQAKRHYGLIHD